MLLFNSVTHVHVTQIDFGCIHAKVHLTPKFGLFGWCESTRVEKTVGSVHVDPIVASE